MTYIYSKGPSAYLLASWSISDRFPVVYYRYINSNQYNYEQSFLTYILNVLLQQAPTLNWAQKRRARQMAAHTVPAPPARVAMTTILTLVNTLKAEQRSISPPDYTYTHQMSHMYITIINIIIVIV